MPKKTEIKTQTEDKVRDTSGKTLKYGKVEVTVFYSDNSPALQECIVRVLHSHMTEKPKI